MRLPFEALSPSGLWLLAGLVPLVVLYILKIRRQRLRVPSVWLWASVRRDLMARSPFQRLVVQVPLVLQALALVLLALALARIGSRGRTIVGDHVAIVVDTSASMSAEDPSGRTRMELAREAAEKVLASLTPGGDAMIVEAGREATVVAPLDRDPKRLRAAIEHLSAADVEGDLGAGVALAVDRLRQLGGMRRIVVVTDGALAKEGALSGASLPLDVVKVGDDVDNAAIIRVDVRAGADPVTHADQVQAFAMIANFGRRPRELYVTLREENASDVLASRRILVEPGQRLPVELTWNPSPGDVGRGLVLDASPHDAMPVDDVAYARVPAGQKMPVVLAAAKPSAWIERALASDPNVELSTLAPADLAAGVFPIDALVVADGVCPPDGGVNDLLVVDPPKGRCLGATVGETVEHPLVTSWATNDARLRFLTLDDVHLARASMLAVDGAEQKLVRVSDGTVVADASGPGRSATIVGFDVGDSDWPLKASFVIFMRNVVEMARARRAHGITGALHAGEPMRISVPATAARVRVDGPNGESREVPARAGLAVVADVRKAGLWHVSWQGQRAGSAVVATNLASEHESDVRAKPLVVEKGEVAVTTADRVPESHTEWTWLLAALALALLVADVLWLTRRPRTRTPAAPLRPKLPDRRRA